MIILSTLFIMVFSVTQVKNENILIDSSDCQTKCPIRRQTIRSYPPGTLLFVGDECVCGGAQETIYEYIPAVQPVGNLALSAGFKPKEMEPLSNNRVMGNYGSLVFSANVQILDLLRITNDDVCIGCYDHDQKKLNPSNAKIISTTKKPTAEVNIPTTIPILKNVSSMKSETTSTKHYIGEEDMEKYTNVSIFTEPMLGNTMTATIKESTPESYVTNDSSEILTSIDIEIQTSTVKPKHKEVFTTKENNTILEKNNTLNELNSKEKPNLSEQFKVTIINSFFNNKSDDLEILIINTDTFNFNN